METCGLCRKAINDNEIPQVWRDKIVCLPCRVDIENNPTRQEIVASIETVDKDYESVKIAQNLAESRRAGKVAVPKYGVLNIVSVLATAVGFILLIGGGIALGVAIFVMIDSKKEGMIALPMAAGVFFAGFIYLIAGQLLSAFRDIAINSFHVRNNLLR